MSSLDFHLLAALNQLASSCAKRNSPIQTVRKGLAQNLIHQRVESTHQGCAIMASVRGLAKGVEIGKRGRGVWGDGRLTFTLGMKEGPEALATSHKACSNQMWLMPEEALATAMSVSATWLTIPSSAMPPFER